MNDIPLADFDGLTPNEMHLLLYGPFSAASPLHFSVADLREEDLDGAPLFQLIRYFLEEVKAQEPMKLTQKGNLPLKLVLKMWDSRIIPGESSWALENWKPRQEMDWLYSHWAHLLSKIAGLVKKRNNKLSLTKQGADALADPVQLYAKLLQNFVQEYNWAYLTYDPERIAQLGAAYSIYLFLKYGREERPASFYSEKYLRAFPIMLHHYAEERISQYSSVEEPFRNCYSRRTFDRFMGSFGLAGIRYAGGSSFMGEMRVRSTSLLSKVFHFERMNPFFAEN